MALTRRSSLGFRYAALIILQKRLFKPLQCISDCILLNMQIMLRYINIRVSCHMLDDLERHTELIKLAHESVPTTVWGQNPHARYLLQFLSKPFSEIRRVDGLPMYARGLENIIAPSFT